MGKLEFKISQVFVALGLSVLGVLLMWIAAAHFHEGTAWQKFTTELGIAFVISAIIYVVFEFRRHSIQEKRIQAMVSAFTDRADDKIKSISDNVFSAILTRNFPKEVFGAAVKLIFTQNLFRKNFRIDYTMSEDSVTDNGTEIKFTKFQAMISYKLRNISGARVNEEIKIGLPNPLVPSMIDKVQFIYGCIEYAPDQARELNAEKITQALRAEMKQKKGLMGIVLCDTIGLDPGQEVSVRMEYIMCKELEDSEFVECRYACDGLSIGVNVAGESNNWDIHCRKVPNEALRDESGMTLFRAAFVVREHLLPHQGVLLWWKQRNRR